MAILPEWEKLTDANGQVTSWKYDAQGRNYEKVYPNTSRKESITYQPLSGRVATTTDTAGQITTYTYNMDGSLKTKSYSNLATGTAATPNVSYTYDPHIPRLATMTTGTDVTSLAYYPAKAAGSSVIVPGAMKLKSVNGPLTEDTDLITYTYDNLGRPKTTAIGGTGTTNVITGEYDNLGRIKSIVNPLVFDPLVPFTYSYDGNTTRLAHIGYANGQKTSFGYYPAEGDNRLQAITNLANGADPASTLSRFDYTYLADGNIATWQRQFGSDPATLLTLGYDNANQLTSATLAAVSAPTVTTKTHAYRYDPAGNRTSRQSGGELVSATYNSDNRITGQSGGGKLLVSGTTDEPAKVTVSDTTVPSSPVSQTAVTGPPPTNLYQAWLQVSPGTRTITVEAKDYASPPNTRSSSWTVAVTGGAARSFTYDGNGNITSDGIRTCEWDAENRLVKVTRGGNVYEFGYDGFSRRISEKVNGSPTKYWIWDGARLAEQRSGDGSTVQRRYYPQGEQRIGGTDAGYYYYTRDHLGSIREMSDRDKILRVRYDYDPYGTRTELPVGRDSSGNPVYGNLTCDFGFTGHHYHAGSDLHLTLYRAYDQSLGRWLSPDPLGEEGGLNLYGYVDGNPVNAIDPLGLIRWADQYSRSMGEKIAKTATGRALLDAVTECEKKKRKEIRIYYDMSKKSGFTSIANDIALGWTGKPGSPGQYLDASGKRHDFTHDVTLVHELQHALDSLEGRFSKDLKNEKCSRGFPNLAEERGVQTENKYLSEIGKPLRIQY